MRYIQGSYLERAYYQICYQLQRHLMWDAIKSYCRIKLKSLLIYAVLTTFVFEFNVIWSQTLLHLEWTALLIFTYSLEKRKLKRDNTPCVVIHKSSSEMALKKKLRRQRESWRRRQKILKNCRKITLCIHTPITLLATQQLYNLYFQLVACNFTNLEISGINFSPFGDWLLEIFAQLRGNSSRLVNFSVTLQCFCAEARAKYTFVPSHSSQVPVGTAGQTIATCISFVLAFVLQQPGQWVDDQFLVLASAEAVL